jgi:hypothetical protein
VLIYPGKVLGSHYVSCIQRRQYSSQDESNKNYKSEQTSSDEKNGNNNDRNYNNFEEKFRQQEDEIRNLKDELERIYRRRQQARSQRQKVWLALIVVFGVANVLLYLISTSVPPQHTVGNVPVGHALDPVLLERLNGKWIEKGSNSSKTKEEIAISMLEFDLKTSKPSFIQSQKSSRSGAESSRSESHLTITSSTSASNSGVLTSNSALPELATKITAVTSQPNEFVLAGDELAFNNKKYTKAQ